MLETKHTDVSEQMCGGMAGSRSMELLHTPAPVPVSPFD